MKGRSLGQLEGQEAQDMWWPCVLQRHSASGNPEWVHLLKLGKVVEEIAEHVVEKRVRRGIRIQRSAVRGCLVCHALLVMKHAA